MTSYGAIALSSAHTRPAEIAGVVSRVLDGRVLELAVGDEDVQFSVAHDHHDAQGWLRLVDTWHAILKQELADISVGHAAPRTGPSATRRTLFEAAEALRLGERAFGGGHLTGYGDAQLAAFCHDGFWQPMDTMRDVELLEGLWARGDAPWKVWT